MPALIRNLGDRFAGLPAVVRGSLLMLAATVCFSAMQGAIRHVGEDLPPFEVAFFRNLFGLFALTPLFLRHGLRILYTSRLGGHALRGLIQAVSMLAFFTGITMIPLADVTALSFSAPLFATLLAVLFLGERVRARRISALMAGFVGVLVVVRPGVEAVGLGAVLIIASSIGWAGAMAIIKLLTRTESSVTLTAYMALFMTPITLVPALFVWQWPEPVHYAWFVMIGGLGTLGHILFAQSFKLAEASAVLPFDFTRLIWASVIGYLAFAEIPTLWAWAGGGIIFASATYIAYREARLSRQGLR